MGLTEEVCYWCGRPATSREHVPPKCLFPEEKDICDIYQQSFRKNLMTVPSCEEHNLEKSSDDEYLMACLGARVGNNAIAYIHTMTKLSRTFNHHPNILTGIKDSHIEIEKHVYPVKIVTVDTKRLVHSFESIARALYYYEFGNCYKSDCKIISKLFFNPEDKASNNYLFKSCELIENEQPSWGTHVKGDNPKIFTYQFSPVDGFGSQTLALTFYERTKVYACLINFDKLKQYKARSL